MKLSALMHDISYRLAPNSCDRGDPIIKNVTADYRLSREGTLYVCTSTLLHEGHIHAPVAYEQGCRVFLAHKHLQLPSDAMVMLVENTQMHLGELAARVLEHPARSMTVFGVTGSAGKTSVVHTLTALLGAAGKRAASISSDGVCLRGRLRPHGELVPDAAEIQTILRRFADAGVEYAVLEFSAYMLAQKSAFSIPFTAVSLTNLFPCHVGDGIHRRTADYEAAKASLFDSDAPFWVLPANLVGFPPQERGGVRVVRFGEDGALSAQNAVPFVDAQNVGARFDLVFENGEKHAVSLPVMGDFAIENALCAAALARIADVEPRLIAKALSRIKPRGRMECVGTFEGRRVFVDSAYDAPSLTRALRALRAITEGKLSVVIGSVGGRAVERRAPLACAAARHADFVYLTADNPNFEDPKQICRDMAQGIEEPDRYCILPDRRAAIERAILEMRPFDTLLIAGKGGEPYQLITGERMPFSEKRIVEECLSTL